MKLALLFAKFLYQHKQLNLPGIGMFSIDASVAIPEAGDKNAQEFLQHIKFSQQNISKPDEEFITFIRAETGKIRPLAESDLESFLSDGKILLNIGKPFHLEGIGTLQKNKAGHYEFHSGIPLLERLENFTLERKSTKTTTVKQPYEAEYNTPSRNTQSGRMAWIVLAIVIGLGAIIWGGYSLYNSNTNDEGSQANSLVSEPATTLADTLQTKQPASISPPDSPIVVNSTATGAGTYKFVFRIARSKNYIVNRFNDLKTSNPNVYWDTKDSIFYRLYVSLPASSSDTARIRDSLQRWYGTKKVIIE